MVSTGRKTEFRANPGVGAVLYAECPTPVVAYTWHKNFGHEYKLMVLEACWQEPLGAISEESLRNEGFNDIGEFRRHWCAREKRRFPPLRMATVFRIRPWRYGLDEETFSTMLFKRLYGEYLDGSEWALD